MYSELQVTTNFSFLRGASHPQELVWKAAELGYDAIGITDYNSLAGVVRAHAAARDAGIVFLTGCKLQIEYQGSIRADLSTRGSEYLQASLLVYPKSKKSYGRLCRLLTKGRKEVGKNDFFLSLENFLPDQNEFVTIIVPPFFQTRLHVADSAAAKDFNTRQVLFYELCKVLKENSPDRSLLSIALTYNYGPLNQMYVSTTLQIAKALDISVVATNDVHYHVPERRPLQDVLTCIHERCTVQQAGFKLFQNGERHLKPPTELARLFREIPNAISRTREIKEIASQFSLSQLKYKYPDEICPEGRSPLEYLTECTLRGAHERYPLGIPEKVAELIRHELVLIEELEYEKYFLTCYDIVKFARSRDILCQGRGAAANSTVCFCLGITSVDPSKIDLLFARFVSKERKEPPDIDIDFEHERREEVIQYIYARFGLERAALTAGVVTYRARSAVREVAKALGLSLEIVDKLAKSVHRWTECKITADTIREIGLDPFDSTIQNALALSNEIVGFPRHLSQHVGGFIISQEPLCEIVPILNAGMEGRTIIEWDKNDIEELGMLKIDVLALGMLTCIRKALDLVNARRDAKDALTLATVPREDPAVYEMVIKADTVGVFQIESRAQMSMLPRLKPRCFYDLVIQVAIVRPGPIQGNMVHPYLRRRNGQEKPFYPDTRVKDILGKTLGVPLFQEQAMRLAIVLANFSPGEAEKLRRAMAAWKTNKGVIEGFKQKIVRGMTVNGYSASFAETCFDQLKGFSEYGFPESHAASFALLVYVSCWLKCHYPAEFYCALLNSQPMGFYSPSQIVSDAQRHGIEVLDIDVNRSSWNCSVKYGEIEKNQVSIRLGMRLVAGLREDHANVIQATVQENGEAYSISTLRSGSTPLSRATLQRLARADAFRSLGVGRRSAHWEIQALSHTTAPLDSLLTPRDDDDASGIREASTQRNMFEDYASVGLSLRAHPLQFARTALTLRGAVTAEALAPTHGVTIGTRVAVAGLATIRQRPGTARGVVFITIEDETGNVNLIIRPALFEQRHKIVIGSLSLIAHGLLERIGDVVYVDVHEVESADPLLSVDSTTGIPIHSYSY